MNDQMWQAVDVIFTVLRAQETFDVSEAQKALSYLNAHRSVSDFRRFLEAQTEPAGRPFIRSRRTADYRSALQNAFQQPKATFDGDEWALIWGHVCRRLVYAAKMDTLQRAPQRSSK